MSHRKCPPNNQMVCFRVSDLMLIGLLLCLLFGGGNLGNVLGGVNVSGMLESLIGKSS